MPLFFYLWFGEVGGLGWGLTVFLVAWFLFSAVGLVFGAKPQYHTAVSPRRGAWGGRTGSAGSGWSPAQFGPLLGWGVTAAAGLTAGDWRWLYGARAALAIGLPVVTAMPLLRYARGRAALLVLPLLVLVTLLPVASAFRATQDLLEGPVLRPARAGAAAHAELLLPHTGRALREGDGPQVTPAKPPRRHAGE